MFMIVFNMPFSMEEFALRPKESCETRVDILVCLVYRIRLTLL